MEADEKRDVMLLVAFAELNGKPVTPWDAHAALLRARTLADHYASGTQPEQTRAYVERDTLLPRRRKE